MNEETLEMLEKAIQDAIIKLSELPECSEEAKRQAEIIERLGKLRIEDWRVEMEGMDKAERRDMEKERNREDALIHKMQLALEDKKMKWVRPDTLASLLVTTGLTALVCKFEKVDGFIWPKTLMTFIPRPKIF